MLNDFFRKLLVKEDSSKDVAKKRLRFALVYDKLEVTDDILVSLQNDIVGVISKYFEIDENSISLDVTKEKDQSALVFNSPIIAARRRSV